MKVTNNTSNPMVIGGTHIPPGAAGEVEDWDTVKDTYAVKQFLKADAISAGKAAAAKPKADEGDERKALFAELDKLNVTYDKKGTTPDLLVLLDDAKKKAATSQ